MNGVSYDELFKLLKSKAKAIGDRELGSCNAHLPYMTIRVDYGSDLPCWQFNSGSYHR